MQRARRRVAALASWAVGERWVWDQGDDQQIGETSTRMSAFGPSSSGPIPTQRFDLGPYRRSLTRPTMVAATVTWMTGSAVSWLSRGGAREHHRLSGRIGTVAVSDP